jgi:hypothetical protein
MPFSAGLGGVSAWLAADTDEASEEIAEWFADFKDQPATPPTSGVFARVDDGPRPYLTLILDSKIVDPSLMFAGPEWKRFTRIDNPNKHQYADTSLGSEPMLEVRDDELIVLQPEYWSLYLFLAHAWLLLQSRRLVGLHAATAAVGDRALVLAGASGAGKSTLTLALQEAGAECYGDEWAFFRLPDHHLFPWPGRLHVRPGGIAALGAKPLGLWREHKPGDPKCEVELPKPARPCPPDKAVLFFLDGFADKPQISEIGGADTSRRLLQGILYADPAAFARLEIAAELVNTYPCALVKVGKPAETAQKLIEYVRTLP